MEIESHQSEEIEKLLIEILQNTLHRYTHANLAKFTSNFCTQIGKGGFGSVYKGQLSSRVSVAVKVLNDSDVVEETFIAELEAIYKTYHQNLIQLYGFCYDRNMKALVYEYMDNGSLERVLYENRHNIDWEMLYSIATETAKGIAFLHDGCITQIIHHNVTPANILLDSRFSPKITDFGLAKFMGRDVDHCTLVGTNGTQGYDAPEIRMPYGRVTSKSNVYSFGMLLFEILGRRRLYNDDSEEWFPEQVWKKFENGLLDEIIKECGISREGDDIEKACVISNEMNIEKARVLATVALWCVQHTPEVRPSMSVVVHMLENVIQVTAPPNPFVIADFGYSMQAAHSPVVRSKVSPIVTESLGEQKWNIASITQLRQFTYGNLKSFTIDFSKKVGKGGFGTVYHGEFPDGVQIAVKVLDVNDVIGKTFMAELETIHKAYHRNLIQLYGFCYEKNMKALVYEYMENGSLDMVLYDNRHNIEWEKLYSIATETAKGIAFLHSGCTTQIIHCDLKPANILLDSRFSPKITDFGVAKIISRDENDFMLTGIKGTPGYAAPEIWTHHGRITSKSDVYSFGMLLFEVLGRRRLYNDDSDDWFPEQVWKKFENGQLDEIIEECGISREGDIEKICGITGEEDIEKARVLSTVALWCVQYTPQVRPSMSVVLHMLENVIQVTAPPNPFLVAEFGYSMQAAHSEVLYSEVSPIVTESLCEQKDLKNAEDLIPWNIASCTHCNPSTLKDCVIFSTGSMYFIDKFHAHLLNCEDETWEVMMETEQPLLLIVKGKYIGQPIKE